MFLGTRRIQFLQQKKLCSLSKNDREFFFFKKFYSNDIYRDIKCSFFNPVEKTCRMNDFLPVKVRKRIENLHNFLEIILHRSVPMDT